MEEILVQLVENPSRLADEIPFQDFLFYSAIERIAPELAIDIVNRFSNLSSISVDEPVQDIERFLNLLKNLPNISKLVFSGNHPQDLFDRLPEHSALQELPINWTPSDLEFLRRLKDLINLDVDRSIDAKLIRKLFEQLRFLSHFSFHYNNKPAQIEVIRGSGWTYSEKLEVCYSWQRADVPDLEAAIQWMVETAQQNDQL